MSATAKKRILEEIVPDEVIDLAKELVRIPSYTTDETPVARFLDGFFRRQGLESRLQAESSHHSRAFRLKAGRQTWRRTPKERPVYTIADQMAAKLYIDPG